MTTATIVDLRRTDLRTTVLETPYWITSGIMTLACDDKGALLFSFPATPSVSPGYGTGGLVLLHELVLEVNTVFAGGTIAFTLGNYSLATDAVTTDGNCTEIDPNMYWEATAGAADMIATGFHPAGTGAFLTDKASGAYTTDNSVIPVDATVICIVGILTSTDTITGGAARLHALISVLPNT